MKVYGITGGAGTGKSEVIRLLRDEFNGYVIMADEVARELTMKDNISYRLIVEHFGPEVLADDGEIDRKKLADYVFHHKEALEQLGLTYRDEYMVQGKYLDPVKTERVMTELLKLPDPPTCIILPDDFSAVGAMNALEEMGMSVPDDISIAGYDGIMLSRVLRPKLTTIKQDTERLGREAAKLLISLMRKEISADTPPVVIPGYILEGGSVKKLT